MQEQEPPTGWDRPRALVGAAVVALALAGAVLAVWRERHSVAPTLRHVGGGSVALAVLFGFVGVLATYPVWWEILAGLGVGLPHREGARMFFTTQLGKYVPGSVWPAVMQMEAGRRRGASRATMLAANLLSLLLSCACGLIIAAAILPSYAPHVLARYWWGLLAVPLLISLLYPTILARLFERLARWTHRPVAGIRLSGRAEIRAAGWSVISWLGLGMEVAVLAATVKGWSVSTVALGIGAMALAVPLGVLFIPAPAGAGVRDVILGLVLGSAMPAGKAVALVLASRVITVACDLLAAGMAALLLQPGRVEANRSGLDR